MREPRAVLEPLPAHPDFAGDVVEFAQVFGIGVKVAPFGPVAEGLPVHHFRWIDLEVVNVDGHSRATFPSAFISKTFSPAKTRGFLGVQSVCPSSWVQSMLSTKVI